MCVWRAEEAKAEAVATLSKELSGASQMSLTAQGEAHKAALTKLRDELVTESAQKVASAVSAALREQAAVLHKQVCDCVLLWSLLLRQRSWECV